MLQLQMYTAQTPMPDEQFDAFFDLLSTSLPANEHRSYAAQKAMFDRSAYGVLIGTQDGTLCALMAVWSFPEFRYLEHFAVDPTLRGQGIGGEMLGRYIAEDPRPLVLEVEPPETDIARRRIGFYTRCGLYLSDFPYAQPPLNEGDGLLPLMLMRSGKMWSDAEAEQVRDTLYREVYRCPIPRD